MCTVHILFNVIVGQTARNIPPHPCQRQQIRCTIRKDVNIYRLGGQKRVVWISDYNSNTFIEVEIRITLRREVIFPLQKAWMIRTVKVACDASFNSFCLFVCC